MEAKFSPRVKDVIGYSREEALRLGNDFIGVEHLLLGIIREGDGTAIQLLKEFNIDLRGLRVEIETNLQENANPRTAMATPNIPLVKQAEKVLKMTYLESKLFKSVMIGTEHLLLSMLRDDNSYACRVLNKYGIIYDNVKEELENILNDNSSSTPNIEFPKAEFPSGGDEEGGDAFGMQRKPTDPKSKNTCFRQFWS